MTVTVTADILGKKRFHFIGIGGIGMSALAKILLEMGYTVSGSDLTLNNLTKAMETLGARIFRGHRQSHLPDDTEVVVYSSSIARDNPEFSRAVEKGLPVIQRGFLLGELLNRRKGIAVAGTHGKTTTTAMISQLLERAGLDPTVAVGGEVFGFGSNARLGKGEWFVAESDESDGSFLYLKPDIAVVTNVEMEHSDYYSSFDKVIEAYSLFVGNIRQGGLLVAYGEDKNIDKLIRRRDVVTRTYGWVPGATVYPQDVRIDGFGSTYQCVFKGARIGTVRLVVPGRHNILNSLAVILVGLSLGVSFDRISAGLGDFRGTKRRFQVRSEARGITLVEDYAHHPTEIRAVLETAKSLGKGRIIVVFQPHRYSRTKCFAEEFGRCFALADRLILTDIYAASEKPLRGVSVRTIYDGAVSNGMKDVVIEKKEAIADRIMGDVREGDVILILGAGDIREVADTLAKRLPPHT